jgi:tight adherence protein C
MPALDKGLIGLLLALLVGASVAGIAYGIKMYRAEAKVPGDLAVALEVGASRVSRTDSAIDRIGMRFAPAVLSAMGPELIDKKRRKIDMAGNPGGLTLDRYAARRAAYGMFGGLTALLCFINGLTIFAVFCLAYGWFAADALIWQAIRARKETIERTLPDFLDVLAVVVSAGLGFRQALDRVAEKYEGPWADELRITLRQMDMGVSRRIAFEELRKRNDSEQVSQFVTALQQGEELGAPIADTLIQIANDMRRTDAQNSRRRAAKAIPKTTVVTLAFMVPATLLLIVANMFLGSGADFGSLFDG